MTEAAELLALAERVEAASADQTASLLIEAFDLTNWRSRSVGRTVHQNPEWRGFDKLIRAGGFLDAAMSLVPEGFMWRLQAWPDGVNNAILEKNAGDFGAIDARHTETFAATPELALTAASLRARAHIEQENARD